MPTPPDRQDAAERWLESLARSIDREERQLEAPDFDEILAAAEGRLDESEALVWEERTNRDPQLAARVDELSRFRAAAYPETGIVVPFREPHRRGWRIGALAAAAALLVAVMLGLAISERRSGGPSAVERAPSSAQELFHDGFEAGDPSAWSAVSNSG